MFSLPISLVLTLVSSAQALEPHNTDPPITAVCIDHGTKYYISAAYNVPNSKLIRANTGNCTEANLGDGIEFNQDDPTKFEIIIDIKRCQLDKISYNYDDFVKMRQLNESPRSYFHANITSLAIGVDYDDGRTSLIMRRYDVITECGFKQQYTVTHKYGAISSYAGYNDTVLPGAFPPIQFSFQEFSDPDFTTKVANSSERLAGTMAYVTLTAANMDSSRRRFHVKFCKIVTVSDAPMEIQLFSSYNKYGNNPINVKGSYRILDGKQEFLLEHRFFVLDLHETAEYNLVCDVHVCDSGFIGDNCDTVEVPIFDATAATNLLSKYKNEQYSKYHVQVSPKHLFAVTTDGNKVYTSGNSANDIYELNLSTQQSKSVITSKGTNVYALCMDDEVLVSGHSDGKMFIWRRSDYRELSTLVFVDDVRECQLKDKVLIMNTHDGETQLWNLANPASPTQLFDLSDKNNGKYGYSVDFNERHIVATANSIGINVWDRNGTFRYTAPVPSGNMYCARLTGRNRMVSLESDKNLRLWNLETGENLQTIQVDVRTHSRIAVHNGLLFTFTATNVLTVWNHINPNKIVLEKTISTANTDYGYTLAATDKSVITIDNDGIVNVLTLSQ